MNTIDTQKNEFVKSILAIDSASKSNESSPLLKSLINKKYIYIYIYLNKTIKDYQEITI